MQTRLRLEIAALVEIHDVTKLTDEQLSEMLNGPDTTIGAFCHSGICLAPHRKK